MEKQLNCLICFKKFPVTTQPDGGGRERKENLFRVFCKYMELDDWETCDEPFCYFCMELIGSLYQLNSEIQVLARLTSRIAAKCTAKILESHQASSAARHNGSRAVDATDIYDDDGSLRPIEEIRRSILNRYDARVVLQRCNRRNYDNSIGPEWSASDLPNEYGDDPHFADLSIDDTQNGSDSEDESSRQRQTRSRPGPKSARNHGPRCPQKYEEIAPGKFMYRGTHPFRQVGERFQCESCGKLFLDIDTILYHIYNHIRAPKKRPRPVGRKGNYPLVEIAPNKILYANKYPICFVNGKYRCPLCTVARVSKYRVVAHIRKRHWTDQVTGSDNAGALSTAAEGHHNAAPLDSEESSNGILHDVRPPDQLADTTSDTMPMPIENVPAKLVNPYESGFADPELPVEETLPIPPEEIEEIDRVKDNACKYEEVSPGKYVYMGQFEFQQVGNKFHCGSCTRKTDKKAQMAAHVRKCHYYKTKKPKDSRINYKVEELERNKKYLYASKYIVDVINGSFKCPECPKASLSKYKLMEHIRDIHIRHKEPYICDQCGRGFMRLYAFNAHKRIHEGNAYPCAFCGKTFPRQDFMEKHERRVHQGDAVKKKTCEYCDKKFFDNFKLYSHMATHDGMKRFECRKCTERFRHYCGLCIHRKRCIGTDAAERAKYHGRPLVLEGDEVTPSAASRDEDQIKFEQPSEQQLLDVNKVNEILVVSPLNTPVTFGFSVDTVFPPQ